MSDHQGLEELFSRLKAPASSQSTIQGSDSIWQQQQSSLQPSVSSPMFSPPVQTPNPAHSSRILSPANPASNMGTPNPDQNRTNNLLNLLRSNSQGGQASPMTTLQNVSGTRNSSLNQSSQARPVSAQDLMASFQPKPSALSAQSPMAAAGAEKSESVASPTNNSKDFLLNLLNRPKEPKSAEAVPPAQGESASAEDMTVSDNGIDRLARSFADASLKPEPAHPQREPTPVHYFGSADSPKTAFEAPQPTKPTMFNYVNPFDQLHSSSPLNRSPKPPSQAEPKKFEILKHDRGVSGALNGESTAPVAKSRKLISREPSPTPSPSPFPGDKGQSVSEAVEGVGEKVNMEVEQALAQADIQEKGRAGGPVSTRDNNTVMETPIKKETASDDEVDSSWESAEDEHAQKQDHFHTEVYNFPMKPFVSIQIQNMKTAKPLRDENFMVIAQLKKEHQKAFDQIDRCLVTASQTHIIYAQATTKKGLNGYRIIRQDTGDHKVVFHFNSERIFNVQVCTPAVATHDLESVLGTGVNGTIFWTPLAKSGAELFKEDDIEARGFVMSPVATAEEQSSGSPVKTRAKMSSRHPEYFGVARGKYIHIVAPETVNSDTYRDPKTRQVNSEKYLREHGLTIMTGKAGKDFCFSEDDSMIVSLDKGGNFKFWDIRDLTSRASDVSEGKHDPVELRDAVWSLRAAASGSRPEEKPSVSSIMFLDKERPTLKGVALRYMLIGLKENHILQLWDLGLGKAVQEIRLPHAKDSDGICSITYHPRSGVIALGHPIRNSIYFIHLSAPKYSIAHMDQARYINMLARNDPALPRPESTAIMSGLREFSLSKVGHLRSLDMLRQPVDTASDPESDDATLFELYVFHSKGVVGMPVKRKDLGWDKDSKMEKPIDAVGAGVIEVKELIPPQKLPPPSETSTAEQPKQAAKPSAPKESEAKPSPAAAAKSEPTKPSPAAPINAEPTKRPTTTANVDSYAAVAQPAQSSPIQKATVDEIEVLQNAREPATGSIASPFNTDDLEAVLAKQFEFLYQRIESDKRISSASDSARQDAVLRLVSSTLTENVEKSLNRIVADSITKEVLPAISNSTTKAASQKIGETLPQQLNSIVSKGVESALPKAIQQALKDSSFSNAISDHVSGRLQQQISQQLQTMTLDIESRTSQKLQEAETRRREDEEKIQELSNLVRGLSDMVQNMSESQTAFQAEVLKMQRPSSKAGARGSSSAEEGSAASAPVDPQKEAEDQENKKITQLLVDGEYDSATIAWLQSNRQGELFDQIFLRVNPRYLEKVTPLVALSVSAAITASFETHVEERLSWLSTVLSVVHLDDAEIRDVSGKIMDVLSQRLQGAYMNISEATPNEPSLRRISALNRQVMEVKRLAG